MLQDAAPPALSLPGPVVRGLHPGVGPSGLADIKKVHGKIERRLSFFAFRKGHLLSAEEQRHLRGLHLPAYAAAGAAAAALNDAPPLSPKPSFNPSAEDSASRTASAPSSVAASVPLQSHAQEAPPAAQPTLPSRRAQGGRSAPCSEAQREELTRRSDSALQRPPTSQARTHSRCGPVRSSSG